jgi:uncharacterized protein (TIGR02996 family)
MRDEADFLRALSSDPGDDVARLAFADWLEEHGDPRAAWVRDPAIFRWMGPTVGDPVPALLEALRRNEYPLSKEAAAVLVRVGGAAVPALLAEIDNAGPGAEHAGKALSEMASALALPIIDRLVELADSGDEAIRGPAIHALRAVGPAALPALPALIAALPGGWDHSDSKVAELAVQVLKNLGPAAVDAVGVLLEQYVYPETRVSEALLAIGPAGVPNMLAHIGRLDPEYCLRAAEPLELMGAGIVPLLRQALEDDDVQVRAVAALALAKTAPEDALPHLLDAIESGLFEEGDRTYLVQTIAEMGPAAASAVPTLRRLFDDGLIDEYSLTLALSRLDGLQALGQGLLDRLRSTDPQERARALVLLRSLDIVPPGTREACLKLLEDSDTGVRKAAACLAGKLAQPGDAEALAILLPLLRHDDPDIRREAVIGCQQIGGPDIASALLPLVEDGSWDVRSAVLSALETVEGSVPAIAAAVCRCLQDSLGGVRELAYRALAARPDVLAHAIDTMLEMLAEGRLPALPHVLYLVPHFPLPAARRVALLREGLSRQDLGAREAALSGLRILLDGGEGNEEVAAAIPDLLRLVEEEPGVAWLVGEVLERIGPVVVPLLLPRLGHDTEEVQRCILRGLKGAGEAALPALPGLLDVLKSASPACRQLAPNGFSCPGG